MAYKGAGWGRLSVILFAGLLLIGDAYYAASMFKDLF